MRKKVEKRLYKKWLRFCKDLGGGMIEHSAAETKVRAERTFERLLRQYETPGNRWYHRRWYHTLDGHIADCLKEFESVRHLAYDPLAVEAALWMHDACYDTHRNDNEEQSALFARTLLHELNDRSSSVIPTRKLILFTRTHTFAETIDEKIVSDIDLAILGKPRRIFDRYDRNIRREYAWVPEKVFRERRARVLTSFLARKHIYHLRMFRKRYEKQARVNINRSLAKLARTVR